MSKTSEVLNEYWNGINNIGNVVESRINEVKKAWGVLDPAVRLEAEKRFGICESCPFNSILAQTSTEFKELTGKPYSTKRTDFHCALCLCPLEQKVLAMNDNCGINFWNNVHPDKFMPIKWSAV